MLPQYIGIICTPFSQLWRFVDFDADIGSIHIIAHFHRFVKRNFPDFPAIVRLSVRAGAFIRHKPLFLVGLHPDTQLFVKVLQRLASQVVQVRQDKVFRQITVELHDRQLILCIGFVHNRFLQLSVYDNGGLSVFQLLKNGFEGATVFVVFGNSSIGKTAINNGLPNCNFQLLHFDGVFFNDIPYPAIIGGQFDDGTFRSDFKRSVKLKKRGLHHHAARLELQTKASRCTRLYNKTVGFGFEHNSISHAQQLVKKRVIVPANLPGACFRQAMNLIKSTHALEERPFPVVENVRAQRRGTKSTACLCVIVSRVALIHNITPLLNKHATVHCGVNIRRFSGRCHRGFDGKSPCLTVSVGGRRHPHNGIPIQALISFIVDRLVIQDGNFCVKRKQALRITSHCASNAVDRGHGLFDTA
uniref:Uncharacterized protein n=1 Tax=Podoviridae sp. ctZDN4 TaxID=2825258 RepID=A0A8S5U4B3_9CAUD|nr:MAG TPA: hypothetical protein [Podoviridae sp. ctZDN4]